MINTTDQLIEISNRLEHLENAAEWIAKETVHTDNGLSQTGTLICVLVDEVREAVFQLAQQAEVDSEDEEKIH